MGETTETPARQGAVQHVRAALDAEDMAEANYHIKEALQLLDVDAHPDADH